jgi:MFS family permease
VSQLLSLLRNRNVQLLLSYFFLRNLFQLGTTLFAFYVFSILKLTPEQWGYIIFTGYVTSTITSFVGGSVADIVGRKKTYLLGVLLIGLGWLSLAFFKNWVHVAVAYGVINGAIAGVYPAYTGLVSQIVGEERLGGGLGLLNTARSAFSILGAFIAGVVAEYFGFPTLYIMLFVFCFLGIIPLWRIQEEKLENRVEQRRQENTSLLSVLQNKSLAYLCFAVFIVVIGGYVAWFYPDYVQRNFSVTSIYMGVFDSVYALIWMMSNYPAGWLSDAIGRKRVIATGFLIMGIAWAPFSLPGNLIWLYVLYGLYSIGNSMGYFTTALAMDVVPKEKQSTAVGIFNSTIFLAEAFSGILGGILWTRLGLLSFLIPIVVYSIASAIISLFVR